VIGDTYGTNVNLTITNVQASNEGSYDVVVTSAFGSVTSAMAVLTVVSPPEIISTTPPAGPGTNWLNATSVSLSVAATNADPTDYPLSYQWSLNGTSLPGATSSNFTFALASGQEGDCAVTISDGPCSTNISWGTLLCALPGMVETWGDDEYGECNRPISLTNATGIAAGEYQSVAVTDNGTVVQWGQYSYGTNFYSVSNTNYATLPPGSNVVAVSASLGHAIALLGGGSVVTWGLTNDPANTVPTNLLPATAVAAGWEHNVALLTNGMVAVWGDDEYDQTNVPTGLSNVIAIAAGAYHSLALLSNGTVVAWGDDDSDQTNVPTGLSNVVAIAAGDWHSLALQSNGIVIAWGDDDLDQTNVPTGMSNVMAIAGGSGHSLALINDGTLVAWGDDSEGQTNAITQGSGVTVKLIAAGGDHSMAAIFSQWVQYPVDVSKDLLLIYNTNSSDSSNVCAYYLANRPGVSNANVLGIGVITNDPILPSDYTNIFQSQVQMWLSNNPTKRPLYVILFQSIPQEVDWYTNAEDAATDQDAPSVQYHLHYSTAPGWYPFVTAINMNGLSGTNFNSSDGTNDCIAYIDKLVAMASNNPPGTLFISATATHYGNINWYFDDDQGAYPSFPLGLEAAQGVESNGVSSLSVTYTSFTNGTHITEGTNVAGYFTWGYNGGLGGGYDTNEAISFVGASTWYLIATAESFNGQRVSFQGNFLAWFSSNAFAGTNYSNTPVGAITHVNEPDVYADDCYDYFGDWAAGKSFAICAWAGQIGTYPNGMTDLYFQAVGDPFIRQ
jgi:hypothetical protein